MSDTPRMTDKVSGFPQRCDRCGDTFSKPPTFTREGMFHAECAPGHLATYNPETHIAITRSDVKWTDLMCGAMSREWFLCNLPPRHTCAHVAIANPGGGNPHVVACWLSGSPDGAKK